MMATQQAKTPATNIMLCYPNRIDEADLSGGSWSVNAPLENAHDRLLAVRSRSSDTDPVSTVIDIDLTKLRPVRAIAVIAHNLSAIARYKISVSGTSFAGQPVSSAGLGDVWPIIYPFGSIPWEHPSFWTGRALQQDIEGYSWSLVHILPETQIVRFVRIEIEDTNNPDGFIEFGRLFVGDAWQPHYNQSYGAEIQYVSRTDISEAMSGAETFDRRPAYRQWSFSLDWLSGDEAKTRILEMQRQLDVHGEVLFIQNSTDIHHRHRLSFLGRMARLSGIERANFVQYKNAFRIKEII